MKTIILDNNAPQGEALKAVNVTANVDFNAKALYFNGKQQVPYQGKTLDIALDQDFNVRITELEDATAQQPVGDAKTKAEAKLVLANTAYAAIESAVEAYMQGVYELNNPEEAE